MAYAVEAIEDKRIHEWLQMYFQVDCSVQGHSEDDAVVDPSVAAEGVPSSWNGTSGGEPGKFTCNLNGFVYCELFLDKQSFTNTAQL